MAEFKTFSFTDECFKQFMENPAYRDFIFNQYNCNSEILWCTDELGLRARLMKRTGTITFYFRPSRKFGNIRKEKKIGRFIPNIFQLSNAQHKCIEFREDLNNFNNDSTRKLKLKSNKIENINKLVVLYLEYLKKKIGLEKYGITLSTYKTYESTLNHNLVRHLGDEDPNDYTFPKKWNNLLLDDELIKNGTKYKLWRQVSVMEGWASRRGYIQPNLFKNAIDKEDCPKRGKRHGMFTEFELPRLFQALYEKLENDELTKCQKSSVICILLLAGTGMRLDEVRTSKFMYWGLKPPAVNLPSTKKGAKLKLLFLRVANFVDEIPRDSENNFVCPGRTFGRPIAKSSVQRMFDTIQQEVFPDQPRRIIHDLRRSFATMLSLARWTEIEICDWMKWLSPEIMKDYVSPRLKQIRDLEHGESIDLKKVLWFQPRPVLVEPLRIASGEELMRKGL